MNFRLALPSKFPGASFREGKVSFPFPRENAVNSRNLERFGETDTGWGCRPLFLGAATALGLRKGPRCPLPDTGSSSELSRREQDMEPSTGKGIRAWGEAPRPAPPAGDPVHPKGCPKDGQKSPHL